MNKLIRLGTDVARREDYTTGNYNITWENNAQEWTFQERYYIAGN